MIIVERLHEPAKIVADGIIGSIGIMFWVQGVTLLTAIGGLLLIGFRIAIAAQEFRLNRMKLEVAKAPLPEVLNEPGT